VVAVPAVDHCGWHGAEQVSDIAEGVPHRIGIRERTVLPDVEVGR
jgi:hypothetical protein